jgi:hypothetical protein
MNVASKIDACCRALCAAIEAEDWDSAQVLWDRLLSLYSSRARSGQFIGGTSC